MRVTRQPDPDYRTVTAAQSWGDQDRLPEICAPRPIRTGETYEPNGYYGHAAILRSYAGLPSSRNLKLALPHGVESDDYRAAFGPREPVPVVTYAKRSRRQVLLDAGVRSAMWPLALPYAYLLRMLPEERDVERRGTIFFPHHSGSITVAVGLEEIADSLQALPEEYQPVTACLFFIDIRMGHAEIYERRGIRVVSAGHSLDPLFLARFHHLVARHRYASSDDVGSPVFYAIRSGCRYFHNDLGEPRWRWEDGSAHFPRDASAPAYQRVLAEVRSLADLDHDAQLAYADEHLGTDLVLEPSGLRRLLLAAERADRTGVVRGDDDRLRVEAPAAVRRALGRARRALQPRPETSVH